MPGEDFHLAVHARSQAHIGVGRASCPSPSPLRTVRAIFPHTALQLVVHLQEDWRGRAWAVVREYSPCSAK